MRNPEELTAEAEGVYMAARRDHEGGTIRENHLAGLRAVALHAIELDRAQREYRATIEYPRTGQRSIQVFTIADEESVVDAITREGDAAEEWSLVDVELAS